MTPRTHLRGLDGLRGIAACAVIVYHVSVFAKPPPDSWVADVASVGWVGVDLFFAISGFILFLPFARAAQGLAAPVSLTRFASNRARRILPAYLFNLLVLVTLGIAILNPDRRGGSILLSNLTFTAGYANLPPVNGVYWTLFCEAAFYVVLPLLATVLVPRRALVGVPLVFSIAMAYKAWAVLSFGPPGVRTDLSHALEQFPAVLDQFLMGMVVALGWVALESREIRLARSASTALAIGGLAAIPVLLWVLQDLVGPTRYWAGTGPLGWLPILVIKPLISLSAAVAIFGVCHRDTVVTRLLELRPVRYLGVVSFGLYLWHLPLTKIIAARVPAEGHALRNYAAVLALVFLTTLGWAAVSHRFVETPFLRRRSNVPTTDEDVVALAPLSAKRDSPSEPAPAAPGPPD